MEYTIKFNERESEILTKLAEKKGMSVENLLKMAARFYQTVELKCEGDASLHVKIEDMLRIV